MPPRSFVRKVDLEGQPTIGTLNEDIAWLPTTVDLDSERPRAMLIEDLAVGFPTAELTAAAVRGSVSVRLAMSTGRVARTATAPRPRMLVATSRAIVGKATTGAAGTQTFTLDSSTFPLAIGTLWVAQWMGLLVSSSTTIGIIGEASLHVKYRVVDIDFDLQHMLYDQVDECEDLQRAWWNV